jgi:hypothetical protein
LISEILEGHRNWLWLLGTRRIGKTSVLKQIEFLTSASHDGRYFPVFWDFQGAEDPGELHRGFGDALLDAEDRLQAAGIDPGEIAGADLFESVSRLRRRLRSRNLRLLLLCDEVEELIKLNRSDPALLSKLRRMLQGQEDVRSVMASTIRLWALADQQVDTSPFLHGFTPPLYIRGLADAEALDLIAQSNLSAASRPAFDGAVAEEIRRRCDNHPYLIQLVCKRYLELGDLKEALEQVGADQMVSYFFSVDFEMLSQPERDVIRVVAEQSSAQSNSIMDKVAVDQGDLSGILLRLEQLGYLRRNAERRFELGNSFFKRWFLDQPRSQPGAAATSRRPSVPAASEATTHSFEKPGELFDGRYRLQQQLGQGGAGTVHKAYDEMLGEAIALKLLRVEYSSNPELMERFRREILLSRDLGHPNILPVYHLGDCRGQRYLAMKLIDGSTLAALINREGALPIERIVDIAHKITAALEAAHARKVIHRDIKPSNILLDRRGEPYLSDFGLARLLTGPGMTHGGVFLGTPDYASPEQARLLPSDERSDLYSLGVVLFEMTTGKRPFVADSSRMVLRMHCEDPVPDPRLLRPGLPEVISRAVLRCLEKDAARRFQTARQLRQVFEGVRGT